MDIPSFFPTLRDVVPNQQTPWQFSPEVSEKLQVLPGATHAKIEITPDTREYKFVQACYEHSAPINRMITKIWCIYNPISTREFEQALPRMEEEAALSTFEPDWGTKEGAHLRNRVFARWQKIKNLFSPFQDKDQHPVQNVTLLPVWHGTSEIRGESICRVGFTFWGLGGQDLVNDGQALFGNAMYFTNSAEYAETYSDRGNLLLGWISVRSPYPVIGTDHLQGGGHVRAHDVHYVPVAQAQEEGPFLAAIPDRVPKYDEIVVFKQPQTLLRFWVKIDVALITNPAPLVSTQTIQQLSEEILKRLQEGVVAVDSLSLQVVRQLQEIKRTVHERVNQIPEMAFGKTKWMRYFELDVEEPFLPVEIDQILDSPHPFVAGQRIRDGFWLTLVPGYMTLKKLDELTLNAKEGNKIGFRAKGPDWHQFNEITGSKAHWVLMSKKTIPHSEKWDKKPALQEKYEKQGYMRPHFVDAATCMLVDCVETGKQSNYLGKPQERLPGDSSYTECLEIVQDMMRTVVAIELFRYKRHLRVGGITSDGLDIGVYPGEDFEVAAVKTFY